MQQQQQHLQTSSQHNTWLEIDSERLMNGVTKEGVRYLKLFLIDYKNIFGVNNLNASCSSCIRTYHSNYKQKFKDMENSCNYKLKNKYNGLPLSFGSQIYVTNNNITDEYAEKLLERYEKDVIFEKYPKEKKEVKEATPENQNDLSNNLPKKQKRRRK